MLTFTSLGYTSSIQGTTSTFEAYLEYRYGDSVCTNFDHSIGESAFTGKARLTGEAWVVATGNGTPGTTVSIGTVPPLTLTVVDGTFNTVGSIGSCDLTGSFAVQTNWSVDGTDVTFGTVTAASLTVHWGEFTLFSESSVVGGCSADYDTFPGPASQTASLAAFTLLRTGTCPV